MSRKPRLRPAFAESIRKIGRSIAVVLLGLLYTAQPAAASHGNLGCSPSQSFEPLFQLLHALTELAFLGGVLLATLGFLTAGILIIIPGQEYTRRGKQIAKSVLIGTVLLLSANMIVQFIINQVGSVVC